VVRYGGDEFLILMPGLDREGARQAAARICQRIQQYDFGIPLQLSARSGVAVWTPERDPSLQELLAQADGWLYHHPTHRP